MNNKRPGATPAKSISILFALFVTGGVVSDPAFGEYGDVVINNYSDAAGVRPVIFPHWFHRVRFRCKTCHTDLHFAFKAGGDRIDMVQIVEGQFCGACHNGTTAWSLENCDLCHSAKPGTPTQMHRSTLQTLIVRPDASD